MKKLLLLAFLFTSVYSISQQYTLTDSDVELDENGYITTCTYDFSLKDIIIPDTLDGLEVKGIADVMSQFSSQFAEMDIESLELPASMKHIGDFAFYGNLLDSILLPDSIDYLGDYAFYDNELDSVSIPNTVTYIGRNAFEWNNTGFDTFILPQVENDGFVHWVSSNGEVFAGGMEISFDLHVSYFAKIVYSLTDDDVYVNDGVIDSVSYDFSSKFIVIPDTLDGQRIIGISGTWEDQSFNTRGAFFQKGIKEISLPGNIEFIEDGAFRDNDLDSVYFPATIKEIGRYAFADNSIDTIFFESPSQLDKINYGAFNSNSGLRFNLPTSGLTGFENWVSYSRTNYNEEDNVDPRNESFIAKVVYILTDDDVNVTDGIIDTCTYNFSSKFIVVPEMLDGQKVTGIGRATEENLIFSKRGIWEISLPSSIEKLDDYSFFQNNINSIEFQNLDQLTEIGEYACYSNSLDSVIIPASVTSIGYNAFAYNSTMDTAYFEENPRIEYIGNKAFASISFDFSLEFPSPLKYGYVFDYWEDENGTTYNNGEAFTEFNTSYTAQFSLAPTTSIITLSGTLDFGDIELNHSDTMVLTISNDGLATLNVSDIDLPQGFSANWTNGQVGPSVEKEVKIAFDPTETKLYEGYIKVLSDATFGIDSIGVSGNGIPEKYPVLATSSSLSFGDVIIGESLTKSLTISNTGTAVLEISDIEIPEGFVVDWNSSTLEISGAKELFVTFSPANENTYSGYIRFVSNQQTGTDSVEVTGNGVNDDEVGILTDLEHDVIVYPNPVKNQLEVKSGKEIHNIEIMDMSGKVLYHENIKSNRGSISFQQFNQGLYIIKVNYENGEFVIKSIIK